MSEQIWIFMVVGLLGVIIGGAGGSALFRKAVGKLPISSEEPNHNRIGDMAALAASVAATTATAFREELNGHITTLTKKIDDNSASLNGLSKEIAGLTAACPERHKAVDRRLDELENSR